MKSYTCPIVESTLNEKVVRLIAGLVAATALLAWLFTPVWIYGFLAADFFIRAFTTLPFSPLKRMAQVLYRWLNLTPKMVNAGPKLFASRLGFLMTLTLVILELFALHSVALVVAIILVTCATLEAVFGFCVGCQFYAILQRLHPQRWPFLNRSKSHI